MARVDNGMGYMDTGMGWEGSLVVSLRGPLLRLLAWPGSSSTEQIRRDDLI